jgi:hypothetical protein
MFWGRLKTIRDHSWQKSFKTFETTDDAGFFTDLGGAQLELVILSEAKNLRARP